MIAERLLQQAKWGEQNHPWLEAPTTLKRFAAGVTDQETAKGLVDTLAADGRCTFAAILLEEFCEALEATTVEELRDELVQVAAVAVATIESLDRNGR